MGDGCPRGGGGRGGIVGGTNWLGGPAFVS